MSGFDMNTFWHRVRCQAQSAPADSQAASDQKPNWVPGMGLSGRLRHYLRQGYYRLPGLLPAKFGIRPRVLQGVERLKPYVQGALSRLSGQRREDQRPLLRALAYHSSRGAQYLGRSLWQRGRRLCGARGGDAASQQQSEVPLPPAPAVSRQEQQQRFAQRQTFEALEHFYQAFEDQYRDAAAVAAVLRQRYLPWVVQQLPPAYPHAAVLDLGCGRGDWLQLVQEYGPDGLGVDHNPQTVLATKGKIAVQQAHVLEFLQRQISHSTALVSAFHLIEHLTLQELTQLLQQVWRILVPGGVLLLETPNPRNILVTGGDFYRDPTHQSPVFPDTLEVLLADLGFAGQAYFFAKDDQPVRAADVRFACLEDYVRVSRDYAWVGCKPANQ